MKKNLLLLCSHLTVLALGFALGIYTLPILIAQPAPTDEAIASQTGAVLWKTEFRRQLKGSDVLHWGEGTVLVGSRSISLMGRLAPGPDYKLYLSPSFVETEDDFKRLKGQMLQVGSIKTFENFFVPLAPGIDLNSYNTVIVWCETFSQFITAAKYR